MTKHRLNTSEGAEALGISTDAVRMRARRGKLASEHENGRLYVWVDDDEIDTKRGRTYDADVVRTSPTWVHLNDQLSWFDQKSGVNQRMYKQTRTVEIVLAASIPVLVLTGATWSTFAAAILGAIITIMAGLRQLTQSDVIWIQYRSIAQRLSREKYLFLALGGQYSVYETHEEALPRLAERVETLLLEVVSGNEAQATQAGRSQSQQGSPQVSVVTPWMEKG